jgi:hypothetical protein
MLRFMASWNESNVTPDEAAASQGPCTATAVERTRRLLKRLFSERSRDDRPPLAKP